MSQRITVPLSELQPTRTGRITVPLADLQPTHDAEAPDEYRDPMPWDPNPMNRIGRRVWSALANPKRTAKELKDLGALETAGGATGFALGGIPGAMAGAGIVRGVRGIVEGDTPGEIAAETAGNAALEALPVVGKGLKWGGKTLIRGVLPIAEQEAKQVGKGLMNRGVEQLVERAADAPGLRLS